MPRGGRTLVNDRRLLAVGLAASGFFGERDRLVYGPQMLLRCVLPRGPEERLDAPYTPGRERELGSQG